MTLSKDVAVLSVLTQLLGGIGLFLLGMSLMTDSLKAIAGESLRLWLTRFTGSPLKAMFSGIGLTLLVQSSTATTLATIGFVSAGVLSFSHAIGVIIGANIGTTSTGWMVALLGLKFSIASFALPIISMGALLKLFGRDHVALLGLAIAGFGLLFFGIDLLQTAMADAAQRVDFSAWSSETLLTRLMLVLIGLVMTILLQSSSAAVTTTLAALATQTIDLQQALALVIGQNIGTVATAVLAAIGATASAKRTAAVHVIFNVLTAVVAFFLLLPGFVWLAQSVALLQHVDAVVMVAAFHTAFSLLGALIFIPLIKQLEQLIVYLIPEKELTSIRYLDDSLLEVPALAIAAAESVLRQTIVDIYTLLLKCLRGEIIASMVHTQELGTILQKVEQYLQDMPVPQSKADQQRLIALLRLMVYARILYGDLQTIANIEVLRSQTGLDQVLQQFADLLDKHIPYLLVDPSEKLPLALVEELTATRFWIREQQTILRHQVIERSANAQISAAQALNLLAAQRWLEHVVDHTERVAKILHDEQHLETG